MGYALDTTASAWPNGEGFGWTGESKTKAGRAGYSGRHIRPWTSWISDHVLRPRWTRKILSASLILTLLPASALADCECGYSVDIGGGGTPALQHVFTDLIETNFLRLEDVSTDTDWSRQRFNITNQAARGDYGEMFDIENIATSLNGQGNKHTDAEGGDSLGLQLVVKSDLVDGMVPTAEIDTRRLDLSWGTFRASMKMTPTPGTCAAFFWYFNDTQEIDMEFLSKDFNASNNSYPVNLVIQSSASLKTQNAALTGNFIKAYLPFNPTTDFHEYRIDYIPGQVYFYADGVLLGQMNGSAVPTTPGHLILQHWSNGNPLWSGGPPTQDAVLTVEYVKAYFNSTEEQRFQDWRGRCRDMEATRAVCAIPNINPKNSSARGWFFSDQKNMTNNQTVYSENRGSLLEMSWTLWLVIPGLFIASGWGTGSW